MSINFERRKPPKRTHRAANVPLEEYRIARDFLADMKRRRTINPRGSSGNIKFLIEQTFSCYSGKPAIEAAALDLGYLVQTRGGNDFWINVSQISIREAKQRAGLWRPTARGR